MPRTPMHGTARWQRRREQQLREEPLCRIHRERGEIVPATVADHIQRHAGDPEKFWTGELQSLCAPCHDSAKQSEERLGYSKEIGANGWPVDERHPFHAGAAAKPRSLWFPSDLLWPKGLLPSALPLTIVCGPPASGKSTYVQERAASHDVVIDLDTIAQELCGDARTEDRNTRRRALEERNSRLRALAGERVDGRRAWFITTAALADTRRQWASMLRPESVIVLATPMTTCLDRVKADEQRNRHRGEQTEAIERWWRDYKPWAGDSRP